jgi:hypothetical protein
VQVTFQLTKDDYYYGLLAWRNLRAWRRWLLRCAYFLMSLAVPLVALLAFLRPDRRTLHILAPLIVFAAVWFIFMWTAPRVSAHRQFRNTPVARSPITIDASDSGLHIRSIYADSQVAWSAYVAWGEYKSVFVILPQPRIYVPIPKRAFTEEQITEFREMLRRNILPPKKQG